MSLLPWWAKALVAAGIALLVVASVRHYNEGLREDGRQEVRAEVARQAAAAAEANAKETQRRLDRQQEAQREHDTALARARADADRAAAAAGQLRRQLDQYVAAWRAAPRDPTPTGNSAPAGDPIGVLADVLRRTDARAGVLAGYADAARAAGIQCERSYDALTR